MHIGTIPEIRFLAETKYLNLNCIAIQFCLSEKILYGNQMKNNIYYQTHFFFRSLQYCVVKVITEY